MIIMITIIIKIKLKIFTNRIGSTLLPWLKTIKIYDLIDYVIYKGKNNQI